MSKTQETATSAPLGQERLKLAVQRMDTLSQNGFSEISNLADVALKLMESPDAYLWPESIAKILTTIRAKAEDAENSINSEAESVDCNYQDEACERRAEARRIAEKRLSEANRQFKANGGAA